MKTVIITGASKGIGRAIAEKFAEEHCNLALISKKKGGAEKVGKELEKKYNIKYLAFSCDIRDKEEIKGIFSQVNKEFGSIDILVNNAGVNSRKTLDPDNKKWISDFDDNFAGWDEEISVNLTGTFICSYLVSAYMIKQKSGIMINISSIKGKEATTSPGYGASKAGIIKLTKDFAKALAPYNIRVNCVAPGFINTGMTIALPIEKKEKYKKMIPLKRFGDVKEVANVVSFLASPESSYITGTTINVNGGYLMD